MFIRGHSCSLVGTFRHNLKLRAPFSSLQSPRGGGVGVLLGILGGGVLSPRFSKS